jgi:hypothetical protein
METSKVKKSTLKKMQDRNLDALETFQGRKVGGMNLSQRVWKYVDEWKDHLEMALDVGLGDGVSAAKLARDVRQDLKDPNRLFRRVRDKHGNLVLSKHARAFHPGQGVYRSSVKNAQRLTRSEINMAYRESDFKRWQQLDFVVGFEIVRSNHEPHFECPLCDRLAGKYPKTFKFVGWHPQCMCKAVPILMDDETFDANELGELRAALRGTEYKALQGKNAVTEMPDGFMEWVQENAERQANWNSTPYFIRDNFMNGNLKDGLKIKMPAVEESGKIDYHVPFERLSKQEQRDWQRFIFNEYPIDYDFAHACKLYDIDIKSLENMMRSAYENNEYWREPELRAELSRVKQELSNAVAIKKQEAERILAEFKNVVDESIGWIGEQRSTYEYAKDRFKEEQAEEYPNYVTFVNSGNGGSLDVARVRKQIAEAKDAYNKALAAGRECVSKYGAQVDVAKLRNLLDERRTEVRNSLRITNEINKEIERIEKEANATRVSVPDELKKGNPYMGDDDYKFSPEFFALLDPLKPVRLVIKQNDTGSYEQGGRLVVLANEGRKTRSTWERHAVVYHEYGHAIGDHRRIPFRSDEEFDNMRLRQIERLKKKTTELARQRDYDYERHRWIYKKVPAKSVVHVIDSKLEELSNRARGWDDDFCMRRWGVNHHDIVEMVCSTRDTIMSLVPTYGYGHAKNYFRGYGNKEHEYLAHCFENAFLGNPVFKLYMPDIYNEMVAYIRRLKPAK